MSTMPALSSSLDQIRENFDFLPDWMDRYRYLIELGGALPPLADGERCAETKVDGCMSQVWMVVDAEVGPNARLHFRADSDAHIVKGLIAILLALFSGRPASEILQLDPSSVFEELGLGQHLSLGRRNGLESMVRRVKSLARAAGAS